MNNSRLPAALALSLALHAAVLLLPLLGAHHPLERFALQGAPRFSNAVSATLVLGARHELSVPPLPAEGVIAPQPAIPGVKFAPRRSEDTASSGTGHLPLDLLAYYPTGLLTKRPQPLVTMEQLDQPDLKAIVASGKMVLQLWIDDRGNVARVEVESSTLSQFLTRKAAAGFERLRFTPGERSGFVVGSIMRIEVVYDDDRKPPQ